MHFKISNNIVHIFPGLSHYPSEYLGRYIFKFLQIIILKSIFNHDHEKDLSKIRSFVFKKMLEFKRWFWFFARGIFFVATFILRVVTLSLFYSAKEKVYFVWLCFPKKHREWKFRTLKWSHVIRNVYLSFIFFLKLNRTSTPYF